MRQEIRNIGQIGLMGLMGPMGLMSLMRLIGLMRLMSLIGLMGLIGLISLMGLTSCSSGGSEDWEPVLPEEQRQSDLEPLPEVPIVFSGLEGQGQEVNMVKREAGTRAVRPLSDLVDVFTVWGYKNMSYTSETGAFGDLQTVFPRYYVEWRANSAATSTTNSSNWNYIVSSHPGQSIKFWDWSAKAYRFFAVTGCDAEEPNAPNGPYEVTYNNLDAVPEYTGSPAHVDVDATAAKMAATPYFSHLWFSTGQPATYPDKLFGQPVTLEFLKPYTRVRFMFKYVFPRVAIRLGPVIELKPSDGSKIIRKGAVTVGYPLVGTETQETYTTVANSDPDPAVSGALDAFTEDYDPEDEGKVYSISDEGWYTVLPNTSQGTYTLSLTINDVPKTAVVPANYMQWRAGYSYTYVFKIIDEGGIVIDLVESAVTPWVDMNAYHSVYNW